MFFDLLFVCRLRICNPSICLLLLFVWHEDFQLSTMFFFLSVMGTAHYHKICTQPSDCQLEIIPNSFGSAIFTPEIHLARSTKTDQSNRRYSPFCLTRCGFVHKIPKKSNNRTGPKPLDQIEDIPNRFWTANITAEILQTHSTKSNHLKVVGCCKPIHSITKW